MRVRAWFRGLRAAPARFLNQHYPTLGAFYFAAALYVRLVILIQRRRVRSAIRRLLPPGKKGAPPERSWMTDLLLGQLGRIEDLQEAMGETWSEQELISDQ